ncbi:MAG TPA: hypothetical protein VIR54_21050 [Vicinamibacterales bacterium]
MRVPIIHLIAAVAIVIVVVPFSLSRLDAQGNTGVPVCLGADNVLRFAPAGGCPQGQRMFRLAEVGAQIPVTSDRGTAPSAVIADLRSKVDVLNDRIAKLETELATRENAAVRSTVTAPFEVVDSAGNSIFVVTDSDYAGAPRRGRIHIGRATGGGNYSLLSRNAGGAVVVALGEGRDSGAGIVQVADNAGTLRGRFAAIDGLEVLNPKSGIAIQLKTGSAGAGQFWMYDADGTPMIKAGTTEGNVGLLQAGPGNKCVPSVGVAMRVPDCILGRMLP